MCASTCAVSIGETIVMVEPNVVINYIILKKKLQTEKKADHWKVAHKMPFSKNTK